MNRVAIIGAGTLGRHIAHYLLQIPEFTFAGFYDDFQKLGNTIDNGTVLGAIEDVLADYKKNVYDHLLIGIGYNHMHVRQHLYTMFAKSIPFATFVHPSSYVDPSVTLGKGVVILPGCVLDKDVHIRDNVFFNIGCIVAHDTFINENCFFGPGVKTAGFVTIGKHCFLGIDTTIINNVHLCNEVQTGGGAVIISDIEVPGKYVGTPARFLRK